MAIIVSDVSLMECCFFIFRASF